MTRVPAVREAVEQFFDMSAEIGVNPDEAVAYGAALKAAVLDHRTDELMHQDVVSHSFGVRASGGGFFPVIKKGEPFPIERELRVSSKRDKQKHISVCVVEGDHPIAQQNTHLAIEHIELVEAPAGEPSVDLLFKVDENGLANVSATDDTQDEAIAIYTKGDGP